MRTFVPDRTCWSLLLMTLAIRLRNKLTYNKLRVLIINKDARKYLAHKNGNENPIWSWNDSPSGGISENPPAVCPPAYSWGVLNQLKECPQGKTKAVCRHWQGPPSRGTLGWSLGLTLRPSG